MQQKLLSARIAALNAKEKTTDDIDLELEKTFLHTCGHIITLKRQASQLRKKLPATSTTLSAPRSRASSL